MGETVSFLISRTDNIVSGANRRMLSTVSPKKSSLAGSSVVGHHTSKTSPLFENSPAFPTSSVRVYPPETNKSSSFSGEISSPVFMTLTALSNSFRDGYQSRNASAPTAAATASPVSISAKAFARSAALSEKLILAFTSVSCLSGIYAVFPP